MSKSINKQEVAALIGRIRNEANRTHMVLSLGLDSPGTRSSVSPREIIDGAKTSINLKCDELDKLLGINSKLG